MLQKEGILLRILLTTLNAKYVHSNLALKYLYNVTVDSGLDIELREYTINHELEAVYVDILRGRYDIVCFSCYIWNIEQIKPLCRDLKKACPDLKILLGGPEVTYGAEDFLSENPWADYIIRGEGELAMFQFVKALVLGDKKFSRVGSLTHRRGGKVVSSPDCTQVPMEKLPFPYARLDVERDKVVYYESSRGCPYSCGYCISCLDRRMRFLPMERVRRELDYFLAMEVRQVKFIDRTFNADRMRAVSIWNHLIDNDNGKTNFHFEICADLLDDDAIKTISRARRGLFRFEVGIQSTNPLVLSSVGRSGDLYRLMENTEKLLALGNCEVHADLIAGLPYENYASFARSFNKAYALRPHELQLGFLKVLKGTPVADDAEANGIIYRDEAPYEVISTAHISASELARLKMIETVLDLYYNRGGFDETLEYLDCAVAENSFEFYEKLAGFYYDCGYHRKNHTKEDLYRILLKFAEGFGGASGEIYIKTQRHLAGDMKKFLNPEAIKRFIRKGWEI